MGTVNNFCCIGYMGKNAAKNIHMFKTSLLLFSHLITLEVLLLENRLCTNPYYLDIVTLLKFLAARELFL